MSKYTLIDFNTNVNPCTSKFGYISFRNLVLFHGDKLITDKNYFDIFPYEHLMSLRKKGVLVCVCIGHSNNRRLIPSCLTRMILNGLIGDEELW